MKILGVDWGTKTLGLAVSESGVLARELPEMPTDIGVLAKLIKKESVEKVVIGLPTRPDGGQGPQAVQVKKFGRKLAREVNLSISYEDEAFSSEEAQELGGSHSLAARLVLEQFLNRQK